MWLCHTSSSTPIQIILRQVKVCFVSKFKDPALSVTKNLVGTLNENFIEKNRLIL